MRGAQDAGSCRWEHTFPKWSAAGTLKDRVVLAQAKWLLRSHLETQSSGMQLDRCSTACQEMRRNDAAQNMSM